MLRHGLYWPAEVGERARVLENAITYPAREVSKIMVEAYKKWVLVGLLIEANCFRSHATSALTPQRSTTLSANLTRP